MTTKTFEHNGKKYWVVIEPAIVKGTNVTVYLAYVNNKEPGGVLYGSIVKDGNGKPMLFGDELTAFTNAQAITKTENK